LSDFSVDVISSVSPPVCEVTAASSRVRSDTKVDRRTNVDERGWA